MEFIDIADIKPATYNPRKISEGSFQELQGSLKTLGVILPIIVNKGNNTIVAGHQRTKACKAVGISRVPVFYVENITLDAEILFNQVHNGIEFEPTTLGKMLISLEADTFYENVPSENFQISEIQASIVKDICKLLNEYGDALCAIVCNGEVVFGNNYIRACQLLNRSCHIYVLECAKRELFDYYFSKKYGFFNYEHIDRNDFVQGLAQMTNKHIENSQIYKMALPFILAENNKELHILDFGCGKALSISHLRKNLGFRNAIGLEFFNHNRVGISIEKGMEMIDNLISHIQKYGKFDFVICDSVLNSVNSQKAEDSVLACLSLFCKMNGYIFFCGRSKEEIVSIQNQKRNTNKGMYSAKFLDDNGLTSKMREGQWYFQKFHTKEDVEKIIKRFGFEVITQKRDTSMWQCGVRKVKELPKHIYLDAIDFEFNMVLPNNRRYGRHNDIRELFGYPTK